MGDNERVCAIEPPFTIEKIPASSDGLEPGISRPALNLLSYRGSLKNDRPRNWPWQMLIMHQDAG